MYISKCKIVFHLFSYIYITYLLGIRTIIDYSKNLSNVYGLAWVEMSNEHVPSKVRPLVRFVGTQFATKLRFFSALVSHVTSFRTQQFVRSVAVVASVQAIGRLACNLVIVKLIRHMSL